MPNWRNEMFNKKMFPFDADAHRWMPHATNGNIDTNDNFLLKLRFTDGLGWPATSGHLEPFESRESWKLGFFGKQDMRCQHLLISFV